MATLPPVTDAHGSTAVVEAGPVRELRPSDVPEVARLFMRAYRRSNDPPTRELCDYFHRVFFSDPWKELEVSPSLVFVDDAGTIRGFLGAHPRRLVCHHRTITAVVMGQLMVDPSMQRRGIAWKLGSTILTGPQTLTYGTTASAPAARMWRRLGFWSPPFAGLKWSKRLLSTGTTSRHAGRGSHFAVPLRSLKKAFQRWTGRRVQMGPATLPYRSICDPQELYTLQRSLLDGFTMRSDLDVEHTAWLWGMLADTGEKGRLHSCVVRNNDDQPLGWAVYFLNDDHIAEVLEIAPTNDCCADVLRALFHHAADSGCVRIRGGCVTPELTSSVVELGARLTAADSGGVFHCTDADVQSALFNGHAFFSELDSESWLSFAGR